MNDTATTLDEFRAAKARIAELTTHTPECLALHGGDLPLEGPGSQHELRIGGYAPTDDHDTAGYALRYCLILAGNDEEFEAHDGRNEFGVDELRFAHELYQCLMTMKRYPFGTDDLTHLAIADTLSTESLRAFHIIPLISQLAS